MLYSPKNVHNCLILLNETHRKKRKDSQEDSLAIYKDRPLKRFNNALSARL